MLRPDPLVKVISPCITAPVAYKVPPAVTLKFAPEAALPPVADWPAHNTISSTLDDFGSMPI